MDWRTDDLAVGSFGSFSFLRRYGLTNFSMQSTLATEPQNQTGRKPSTIVDGPDLQTAQFDLRLSRALAVDPDTIIKELQSLLDAQSPRQLVMGGQVLGSYRWLLKSVLVTDAVCSADGGIVYAYEGGLPIDDYNSAAYGLSDYEKSVFKPIYKADYYRGSNPLKIELNIVKTTA